MASFSHFLPNELFTDSPEAIYTPSALELCSWGGCAHLWDSSLNSVVLSSFTLWKRPCAPPERGMESQSPYICSSVVTEQWAVNFCKDAIIRFMKIEKIIWDQEERALVTGSRGSVSCAVYLQSCCHFLTPHPPTHDASSLTSSSRHQHSDLVNFRRDQRRWWPWNGGYRFNILGNLSDDKLVIFRLPSSRGFVLKTISSFTYGVAGFPLPEKGSSCSLWWVGGKMYLGRTAGSSNPPPSVQRWTGGLKVTGELARLGPSQRSQCTKGDMEISCLSKWIVFLISFCWQS